MHLSERREKDCCECPKPPPRRASGDRPMAVRMRGYGSYGNVIVTEGDTAPAASPASAIAVVGGGLLLLRLLHVFGGR